MIKKQLPKILMVSTEYPPMRGGVGRYTFNLVRQLRKKGLNVLVASNEEGDGDFFGLAPANNENYRVLLKIVDEIQPDIVHIQYEHGLYGLVLDGGASTRHFYPLKKLGLTYLNQDTGLYNLTEKGLKLLSLSSSLKEHFSKS